MWACEAQRVMGRLSLHQRQLSHTRPIGGQNRRRGVTDEDQVPGAKDMQHRCVCVEGEGSTHMCLVGGTRLCACACFHVCLEAGVLAVRAVCVWCVCMHVCVRVCVYEQPE